LVLSAFKYDQINVKPAHFLSNVRSSEPAANMAHHTKNKAKKKPPFPPAVRKDKKRKQNYSSDLYFPRYSIILILQLSASAVILDARNSHYPLQFQHATNILPFMALLLFLILEKNVEKFFTFFCWFSLP